PWSRVRNGDGLGRTGAANNRRVEAERFGRDRHHWLWTGGPLLDEERVGILRIEGDAAGVGAGCRGCARSESCDIEVVVGIDFQVGGLALDCGNRGGERQRRAVVRELGEEGT